MFNERNIIYFDPFYFKNGNAPKPKYFVVLKNQNNKTILASLPTPKNSIPPKDDINHGCVELPEIDLNCFIISKDIQVITCGKYFDFKTHIYGHQIDDYEISDLEELYQIENADYEIWGQMKDDLYLTLIDCLRKSKSVKRKYRRMLNQI